MVVLRKLLPQWSDAFANGHKLVEFVSYQKHHGNAMKRFSDGTIMVVSSSGSSTVSAIGIAAGAPVVWQKASAINDALALVPAEMQCAVREYLVDKACFDYVMFSKCYDVRSLDMTLSQFFERFKVAAPRCYSGFPVLQSSTSQLAAQVETWCRSCGGVLHETLRANRAPACT